MAVSLYGSGQTIVQVVQVTKLDRFSTTSTSYTAITGMSASITPFSTSNRILIMVDMKGGAGNSSGGGVQLLRGATAIYIPAAQGSRRQASLSSGYTTSTATVDQMSAVFLDAPATTSSTTYSLQCVTNGGTFGVNSSSAYTDSTDNMATVSSITLIEVAYA